MCKWCKWVLVLGDWEGDWDGVVLAVLAEVVFTRVRARVCAFSYIGVLFFCCHKCHSEWNWKYFITKKQHIVLLKTTYRFMESDVSFYRKQPVVLRKTTCCVGLEVEKLFWGWCFGEFLGWSSSVKVWDVVSKINVNGYYIVGYRVCVTLVTAKNTKLL